MGITLTPQASSVTRHKDRAKKQYLTLHPIVTQSFYGSSKNSIRALYCAFVTRARGSLIRVSVRVRTYLDLNGRDTVRTSGPPDNPIFWLIAIWQCEFHLYIKPFAGSGRAVIGRAVCEKVKGAGGEVVPPRTREGGQGRQTLDDDGCGQRRSVRWLHSYCIKVELF